MIATIIDVSASVYARLPVALYHKGEPNEWVRTTRPGRQLHSFLEGACLDKSGALWLVDVPYGRIFRVDNKAQWVLEFEYDGEPHGLALRPDGTFVVADYRNGLLSYDPKTNQITTLCSRVNSESFRGLGDIQIAPSGDLWFTDPGRSSLSDPTGRVFRLRAGAATPDIVLASVPYPNGVALSPDGQFVYVAATRGNAIWRFLANAPDPVYPMAGVFTHLSGGLGPDGLAVDGKGRLAVAQAQAGRAYIFHPNGDLLYRIHIPSGLWSTSVAFGPDDQTLFILDAEDGVIWIANIPFMSEEDQKGVER